MTLVCIRSPRGRSPFVAQAPQDVGAGCRGPQRVAGRGGPGRAVLHGGATPPLVLSSLPTGTGLVSPLPGLLELMRLSPHLPPQSSTQACPLEPKSPQPAPTRVSGYGVCASGSNDLCGSHSAFLFSDVLPSWPLFGPSGSADLSIS